MTFVQALLLLAGAIVSLGTGFLLGSDWTFRRLLRRNGDALHEAHEQFLKKLTASMNEEIDANHELGRAHLLSSEIVILRNTQALDRWQRLIDAALEHTLRQNEIVIVFPKKEPS